MRDATEEQFLQAIDTWRKGFVNVELDGQVYSPTTSGGYVRGVPANVSEFQEMLRLADLRLYDAKQAGRNTVLGSVYDDMSFARPMSVEQMIEFIDSGASSPETQSRRQYYDAVSSVNLLTAAAMDEDISHKMELSSGLPSAIVQFCKGKASYLAWNSSYLDYLRDIGMNTIENSENQMNDMSRPQSQGFHTAAKKMRGSDEWLNITFYEGEDLCTGAARYLAVDDENDACAFIYTAFNVSSFLAQVGYSIPK